MNEIKSRICTKCKVEKEFSLFHKNSHTTLGISARCKKCYSEEQKQKRLTERAQRDAIEKLKPIKIETHKTCSKCNINKSFSEFQKSAKKRYGIDSKCKICSNERQRAYLALKRDKLENPDKYLKLQPEEGKRKCTRCGIEKEYDLFYKNRFSKSGLSSRCKVCERETDAEERNRKREPEIFTVVNCKICSFCDKEKLMDCFPREKKGKYGYSSKCKDCRVIQRNENMDEIRLQRKAFREKNKDRLKQESKERYLKNREEMILKVTEHAKKNRPKINAWRKERLKTDINFKIACNLRGRLNMAIRGKRKELKTMELLGCSIEEFKVYIASKFEPNMSWDNYGLYTWHIDHCIATDNYDLTDEEQLKECFHHSNMAPRWATTKIARKYGSNQIGNINKGNKVLGVDIFEPTL